MPAPDAYVAARNLFRGLPITKMPMTMMNELDDDDDEEERTRERMAHIEHPLRDTLRSATVPAKLGEVAAFVSYSWRGMSLDHLHYRCRFCFRCTLASLLTIPTTGRTFWPLTCRRWRSPVCPAAAVGKRAA